MYLVVLGRVISGIHHLVLLALHRLHSVMSDFRPPSGNESGEAALRRLLASSGYSVTSGQPTPGPPTFCSSRRQLVARPLYASSAPYLVSLLSSSAPAAYASSCFRGC